MRKSLFLLLLAGCGPVPASIQIEGESAITVRDTNAIPMPNTKVLDKAGNPVEAKEPLIWSVEPEGIATLSADGGSLTAVADGQATVRAKMGTLSASFTLTVGLPDAVEITGVTPPLSLAVGAEAPLTARVVDAGNEVAGLPIAWSSDKPEIAAIGEGTVKGVALGEATITATWGALSATLPVTVTEAVAAAQTDGTAPVDGVVPAGEPQKQ
jgi:hypothetical protein